MVNGVKNQPLVTIVIPVFGTEEYLRRCIFSVVEQSYKHLEIIIINDFSPDRSDEILREFAAKDSRIVYIKNSKNIGLGETRNLGIKYSTGKYIQFLDSDDYLESNTIFLAVKAAENFNADLVEFNFRYIRDHTTYPAVKGNESLKISRTISQENQNFYLYIYKVVNGIVTNKLFKSRIIKSNNLRFKFRIFEDSPFTLEYSFNCERILLLANILYNYVVRDTSITHSTDKEEYFKALINTNTAIFYLIESLNMNNGLKKRHIFKVRNQLAELFYKADRDTLGNYLDVLFTHSHGEYFSFDNRIFKTIRRIPVLKFLYVLFYSEKKQFIKNRIKEFVNIQKR